MRSTPARMRSKGSGIGKDITFPHLFTAKPPQDAVLRRAQAHAVHRRGDARLRARSDETARSRARCRYGRAGDRILRQPTGSAINGDLTATSRWTRCCASIVLFGRLFEQIDSSVGLDNTVIVLSADHGSRHARRDPCRCRGSPRAGWRQSRSENVVVAALAKRYPGVDLISHFATDIYLNEDAVRRNKLNWEEVEKTAVEAMLSTGFFERVYTHDDLSSTAQGVRRSVPRAFQESVLSAAQPSSERAAQAGDLRERGGRVARDTAPPTILIAMCRSSSWGATSSPGDIPARAGPKTSRRRSRTCCGWSFRANRTHDRSSRCCLVSAASAHVARRSWTMIAYAP